MDLAQPRQSGRRPGAEPADALYLTYDGVLEPLGRSQVIPYLLALAEEGLRLELVSFEKSGDVQDAERLQRLQAELARHRIRWTRLGYHRRPRVLSTAFDLVVGTAVGWRRTRRAEVRLVHARSHVAALMALAVKELSGVRLLFDMRGFWPEERVEMGIFRDDGLLFRVSKFFERAFLRKADRIVVLTERAKPILISGGARADAIAVVPCAVDLKRFPVRAPSRELAGRHGLLGRRIVGNLGAVNSRYLIREMFRFAARLAERVPDLCFVYLTREDPAPLKRAASEAGLPPDSLYLGSALPEEIPEWLSLFELGIFFLKPSYAAQASSFTKLAEFLAAGVPVATNAGVGDVEDIVGGRGVGLLLPGLSEPELEFWAGRAAMLLPPSAELRETCRQAAARHFDLERASATYLRLYRELLGGAREPSEEKALPCAASSAR